MKIAIDSQSWMFFYSILFGTVLGVIYDMFRIPRLIGKADKKIVKGKQKAASCRIGEGLLFFQDVLYFFICGILTFLFVLVINRGEIRFFIVTGEIIGWSVYNITLGRITLIVFNSVYSVLKKLYLDSKKIVLKIFCPIKKVVKSKIDKLNLKKSKNNLKFNKSLGYNLSKRFKNKKKRHINENISS